MLDTRARYERNKRNAEKRILERGYIWLWPEFSRVNLTRPVSLVSSSPRNRINREPLLRQRFFSLSFSLPSFPSFFLSFARFVEKIPANNIVPYTVFASHARPPILPPSSRSNRVQTNSFREDGRRTSVGLSRLHLSSPTLRTLSRRKKTTIVRILESFFSPRSTPPPFSHDDTLESFTATRRGRRLITFCGKLEKCLADPLRNLPLSLSVHAAERDSFPRPRLLSR